MNVIQRNAIITPPVIQVTQPSALALSMPRATTFEPLISAVDAGILLDLHPVVRHASPVMTLGTYAKAVTADKRIAQDAIAALFVPKNQEGSDVQN